MADNKNKNNQTPPFDANSLNEMMKNIDFNALQSMLNNIDMNQVAALASKMNIPNPQAQQPQAKSHNTQQYQIPASFYNDPIVAVLNSLKPFIPQDKWVLIDEIIKLLGMRAAVINNAAQTRR